MPSLLTTMILPRRDTQRTSSISLWVQYNVAPLQTIHPTNHSPYQLAPPDNTTINKTKTTKRNSQIHSAPTQQNLLKLTTHTHPFSTLNTLSRLTSSNSPGSTSIVIVLDHCCSTYRQYSSLGSKISHSVSIKHLEVEHPQWSEILVCPSVNQWPFYHPDHFLWTYNHW